ncbi:ead/Ea22-like family protein [Klebsiella pneumoniae]|uniref:ead/Ea22-like family protein n=1 Tax=Klebsiella pneumoniae TaxID=573 RepID=UPI001D0DC1B8|nr:ead/Ea22-like family protein [Klebsiella pneumoniae]
MTDITELAQSLKAAAEKATQGNWRAFKYHDGRCGIGGGHHDEIMVCEHISKRRPHDAEFIALANPANILALVEALEKAQQRIDELDSRTVKLPKLKMLEDYLAEVAIEERKQILVGVKLEFHRALAAAGIKMEAE